MMGESKTAGRVAYEEDCKRMPAFRHRGVTACLRSTWDELPEAVRDSWEKNPTPRNWSTPARKSRSKQ